MVRKMRKSKLGAFTKITGDGGDDEENKNKNNDEKEIVPNTRINRSEKKKTRPSLMSTRSTSTSASSSSSSSKAKVKVNKTSTAKATAKVTTIAKTKNDAKVNTKTGAKTKVISNSTKSKRRTTATSSSGASKNTVIPDSSPPLNLYHKNGRMKFCAYESTDSDSDSGFDSDECGGFGHYCSDYAGCNFDHNFDSEDIDDYGDGDHYGSDYDTGSDNDNDNDEDDYDYEGRFGGFGFLRSSASANSNSFPLGFVSIRNYLNNIQRVLNDPIILARISDFNRFINTRPANQTRSDFQAFMQELAQMSNFPINNFPFSGFNASDYNRNSGLTASEISRLPRHSYRGQTQKEKRLNESPHKCCICMAELELNEELILLEKCSHRFHSNCLESWLNRSAQCPICRCVISPPPLILN